MIGNLDPPGSEMSAGEAYLTPRQLADRWQVPTSLLANWRHQRRGPSYVKIGHAVRYRLAEVTEFEARGEVVQQVTH